MMWAVPDAGRGAWPGLIAMPGFAANVGDLLHPLMQAPCAGRFVNDVEKSTCMNYTASSRHCADDVGGFPRILEQEHRFC